MELLDGRPRDWEDAPHFTALVFCREVKLIISPIKTHKRWYGGIHLGPDRWKHINNSLRTILDEQGQIKRKK